MTDLIPPLTQFGAAGLIGAMWVVERRAAALRERQIAEAHEALVRRRDELAVLVDVLRDNARAIAGIESAQRAVAEALDRLASSGAGPRPVAPAPRPPTP